MNFITLMKKTQESRNRLQTNRSKIQTQQKQLQNKMVRISILKRIQTAVSLGYGSISKIFRMYKNEGKSNRWLLQKIELYINKAYMPRSYSDDDCYR
eukprot:220060_1